MDDAAVSAPPTQKPCIACREPIPCDATLCSHCLSSQTPAPPDRLKSLSTWMGLAGAAIGLFASLWAAVHWLEDRHAQQKSAQSALSIAHAQQQLGDPEAAFRSLQQAQSTSSTVSDQAVDAAMAWAKDFPTYYDSDEKDTEPDLAKLHELLSVLQSALPASSGPRKADILAHIGWTQWKIADFSAAVPSEGAAPAGEPEFRAALALDPANVYANAMLGYTLQITRRSTSESKPCFAAALAAAPVNGGRNRPFVRRLQLAAILRADGIELPDDRATLAQIVNQMRLNGEPLTPQQRRAILNYAYNPLANGEIHNVERNLAKSLAALPEQETWATYQWLTEKNQPSPFLRDFLHASLLEVSGHKPEALAAYQALKAREPTDPTDLGWLPHQIDDAIARLT